SLLWDDADECIAGITQHDATKRIRYKWPWRIKGLRLVGHPWLVGLWAGQTVPYRGVGISFTPRQLVSIGISIPTIDRSSSFVDGTPLDASRRAWRVVVSSKIFRQYLALPKRSFRSEKALWNRSETDSRASESSK